MTPFTADVLKIVSNIPAGRVMTYGGIAERAGSPRAARQVVRILHSMSDKHGLPWHRVINAKGEIAIGSDEGRFLQRALLEEEGVYVNPAGVVDLDEYRHVPDAPERQE
ncbi:methylated-DNA-protein-cysteine methyltransferase related protein [Paenibacillus sp. UNC496MF]|uniref:MGMT family protein n=1 Tax=Paenibacillus sp. UNC496MF TaxID=1502753 RepID=UPI0008EB3C05|nr:MGMT family protein [Paenibacillus sp. UNC496MF]SFI76753.1 methylated-DNA-protein-cysteine methyltransferase related protein [Paenibacillus sp. UNC496MF]